MDTDKRLNELAEARNWLDLTPEERTFVLKELGSEEAYQALRKVNAGLREIKSDALPRPATLAALQHRMRESRKPVRHAPLPFLFFKTPAYLSALMILLAIFVGMTIGRSSVSRNISVQTVYKTDTLTLTSPPDTVFVTRVIYRDRPAAQPVITVANNGSAREVNVPVGVSMKEKEELDNLLVSGSE
jgi:hypothetical protein